MNLEEEFFDFAKKVDEIMNSPMGMRLITLGKMADRLQEQHDRRLDICDLQENTIRFAQKIILELKETDEVMYEPLIETILHDMQTWIRWGVTERA